MQATRSDITRRLWDRVNVIYDDDSCWEWTGGLQSNRRARIRYNGSYQYVYRIAWQLANGPIPEGMYICHHCDNSICCRPSHLFVGTHRDNMIDGLMKGIVTLPTNVPQGATHHSARGSDELVVDVRKQFAAGVPQVVLCRKYGLTSKVISDWVNGKTRKGAGGPIARPGDKGIRRKV